MTISTITALPTAPARTDAPATFISRADAFLAALVTMGTELNTSIGEMNTDIAGVNTDATAAAASAVAAAASEAAAEAASNATEWVSGQSYSSGDVVYSPIDYKSYRANTATSGSTDPSLSADWTALGYELPSQTGNAGKFLTTDGTDESWGTAGGGLQSTQIFTSSGTWTKPSGISKIIVRGVGGGGAGGGKPAYYNAQFPGGGAGGYFEKLIDVSAVSSVSVTIGSGGTGVAGAKGNDGGNTVFTGYCTANGGVGGPAQVNQAPPVGGTATGGDVNIKGQSGGSGCNSGSSGGEGSGGSTLLGHGGRCRTSGQNYPGEDAVGYGGGGGGASGSSGGGGASTDHPGGDGSDGIVIVEEYA